MEYYNIIWFNKYLVIKKLGEGGSGSVYLVQHVTLSAYRAIKRFPKDQMCSHWLQEADILRNLRHPNIPLIYDIEEDDEFVYIIEEYIEGNSLRAYKCSQINLSEQELLDYLIQLCEVLKFLHSRENPIFYLDLKPDNVICTEQKQLKLLDFGAARLQKDIKIPSVISGTVGYAAPEQFAGTNIDARTDIYGLGSLFYYLIKGRSYQNSDCNKRCILEHASYSTSFLSMIETCIEQDPKKRYYSIDKLLKEARRQGQLCKENHKNKTPHVIKIAGLMPRVGTTHVSLMMVSYLNHLGIKALYVEENESRVVEQVQRGSASKRYGTVSMGRGELSYLMQRYPEYHVFICDCGCYKNVDESFQLGRKHFLVMGSKPWEWSLPPTSFSGNILVNYATAQEFDCIAKKLPIGSARIPYAPDCFSGKVSGVVNDFLQELLKDVLKNKRRFAFLWRK
ncbi:MAG: hypothetical protein PWP24_169 [Clostridiales bacterium]|nr:hypothetical protein [Clostridiales bacterium]